MMMEEGPSNGMVHRRHRQRGSSDQDTPNPHTASAAFVDMDEDDVSACSDDSKEIRYGRRRRLLARLVPSRGTALFSAVLVVGTVIASLIFIDDHAGSSLRGKGARLAKEMGRWERRRRRHPLNDDDKNKGTEQNAFGALNYGGSSKQPQALPGNDPTLGKGADNNGRDDNAINDKDQPRHAKDAREVATDGDEMILTKAATSDTMPVAEGEQGIMDKDTSIKKVEVLINTTASLARSNSTDGEEEEVEEEEEEEHKDSEHYRIIEKTRVDVYNTTIPENKELAGNLGDLSSDDAAGRMLSRISSSLEERIEKTFEKTKTEECRLKIAESFAHYVRAVGEEKPLPFENVKFKNDCFFPEADVAANGEEVDPDEEQRLFDEAEKNSWSYQPPRNESEYIDKPENLNILYAILTHGHANETIRLINTLYEDGHTFVVHVDGKEIADETQRELSTFASTRSYVHILPDTYRVRVNWGGFSMVNATLQVMKYVMAVDRPDAEPMEFHKFVHMSATAYPIKSNKEIRRSLSEYPIDANLFWVLNKPTSPHEEAWHYFVECDDAVHRIYRLPPKRWENSGIDIMTSSQWFIASREFIQYLAVASPGTFVYDYLQYIEHAVVADEQFFGTILRHSSFCHKHENKNFLFLEFGEWENFMHNDTSTRDTRKCLMPDPERCGRSPKDVTKERVMALDLEERNELFARKFTHKVPDAAKDSVDRYLRQDDAPRAHLSFEGNGAMIVAKETVNDKVPLCLGLSPDVNSTMMHLQPCFHKTTTFTSNNGWYERGVDMKGVQSNNRFEVGRCSSDGGISRASNGEIIVTPGVDNPAGPRCFIKVDREDTTYCLESISNSSEALGFLHSKNNCGGNWKRTFFFGDGIYAPRASLHLMVPSMLRKKLAGKTGDRSSNIEAHICLAVEDKEQQIATESGEESEGDIVAYEVSAAVGPLQAHIGKRIVTTQCSHTEAVIEWVFVPCIGESDSPDTTR